MFEVLKRIATSDGKTHENLDEARHHELAIMVEADQKDHPGEREFAATPETIAGLIHRNHEMIARIMEADVTERKRAPRSDKGRSRKSVAAPATASVTQ